MPGKKKSQRKPPKQRKRMPEEARRRQLVAAASTVACRDGIAGLTLRAVAAEAQVSHGLVLFHFRRKALLVRELLEWLIESTSMMDLSEDIARFPRAMDQLHALLQQEMARYSRRPEHTRLFLEFWALGAQHEGIRARIGAEIERYRAAFRTIMEKLLSAEPTAFGSVTAEGLSSVVVSWIHGCAIQAMANPEHFDSDEYLAAVRGVIWSARLGATGP